MGAGTWISGQLRARARRMIVKYVVHARRDIPVVVATFIAAKYTLDGSKLPLICETRPPGSVKRDKLGGSCRNEEGGNYASRQRNALRYRFNELPALCAVIAHFH